MSSSSVISSEENISSTFSPRNHSSRKCSGMEQQPQTFGKCPDCLVPYDFIKRANVNISKVPLILPCKHTFCEECIKKSHVSGHIQCSMCNTKFPYPVSQLTKLPEHFTPHYALVGYLMWCKNGQMARKPSTKLEGGFVSAGYTLSKRDLTQPGVESTSEPDSTLDELLQESFQEFLMSMEFDACPMHPGNNFLNMTCETCNLPVCCYCFLEDHNGHVPRYLFKLNEEEGKELPILKSATQQVINQLRVTQKKVQELKSFDTDHIESEIRAFFSEIHGKLHVAEKGLRDRLPGLKVEDVDLEDISYNVKASLFKATHLLKFFDTDSKNNQLNLRALYDEAKLLKNTPCMLVSDSGGGVGQIQFVPSETFDNIEDCFELKRSATNDYRLEPLVNFSLKTEKAEELPPAKRLLSSLVATAAPAERKPRNAALSNLQPNKQQPPRPSHHRSQNGGIESVVITHLNDIYSFFCQKVNALRNLNKLNRTISDKFTKENRSFQLGRIYAAFYTSRNQSEWRRAKVIDINPKGDQFNVFYLDYGNTQLVTKDKLKTIGQPMTNFPPYAFECKLHLPEGTVLPDNARLHMAQIISEKEPLVRFIKTTNQVEEVDVLVANSNGDLVSVIDIMSQSDRSLSNAITSPSSCHRFKLYSNSKSFLVGQSDLVVVCHVNDPHNICVQIQQNIGVLQQLKENMKVFYGKNCVSCIPVENSDVVVKHSDRVHGDWHRAHVVSVDRDTRTVQAHFVDWGVTHKIAWTNVKMLSEEFTRVESQAITVQLADIEPPNNEITWSEPATEFLKKQLVNTENMCKMVVNSRDPLAVALFQTLSSSDLCLNALMVKAGFATGTGKLSETVNWLQNQVQEKINEELLHTQLIKKSEAIIMEDSDNDVKEGFKQQVTVVRVDSPSVIYVKFSCFKELENEMFKYMQVHYGECRTRHLKRKWTATEHCVVWDSKNNNFVRGHIVRGGESDDNVYLVYLYDQGRNILAHQKDIYVYGKFFRDKYRQFVYKCSLANVKPAGDSGKWSQSAIEMLQEMLDTYKTVYVRKVPGEIRPDDISMHVLMWYEKTTPGNALQPSKQNFISLNKALVEAGLAFNSRYNSPQHCMRLSTPPQEVSDDASASGPGKSTGEVTTSSASTVDASTDELVAASADEPAAASADELVADSADETVAVESEKDVHSSTSPTHTLRNGQSSWYDLVVEDETQQSEPVDDWLPPLPFTKKEFEAVLTYIDDEPLLSVCDAELHKMYLEMEKSLCDHFDFVKYPKKRVNWRKGMMCTIHYDGKWYRGRVIADAADDADVIAAVMIDFGSDHLLPRKDLYRQIMYPDLPPFVNSIRLYDVVCRFDRWQPNDVENLIQTVATDTVTVHIKDSLDAPIPFAEVFRNSGESMNQMIVNMSKNLVRLTKLETTQPTVSDQECEDENEYVAGIRADAASNDASSSYDEEEKDIDESELTDFKYAPLPESSANMYVLNVRSYDLVVLDVLNKCSSHASDLVSLHGDIQRTAESQPKLKDIELNQPCICKQADSGIWRRAHIHNVDNVRRGFVMAYFVDLGIVDMVDCESIRAMNPEWLNIPVSSYLAKIDIRLVDQAEQTIDFAMRLLNNMVQKSLHVKITSRDPLHVHLFENNQLCYQKLLDYNLFALA